MDLNVQTQGTASLLGSVKILLNRLRIDHVIARSDADNGTERPSAYRKCCQIFPKCLRRDCTALRSTTTKDCDKVPALNDEYVRTEACIRRAILRVSRAGYSGTQVHLILRFFGAPGNNRCQCQCVKRVSSEAHISRNGKPLLTCEQNLGRVKRSPTRSHKLRYQPMGKRALFLRLFVPQ